VTVEENVESFDSYSEDDIDSEEWEKFEKTTWSQKILLNDEHKFNEIIVYKYAQKFNEKK
jgi:hypothetical protein